VLGANEVACNGDFANWRVRGAKGGGICGVMDLAPCARNVFVNMEYVTRDGVARLVERCIIPVKARGVATLVVTTLGFVPPRRRCF
jgi:acyl CoA:acetate/3-ketoacid CoA transferase beta subunit